MKRRSNLLCVLLAVFVLCSFPVPSMAVGGAVQNAAEFGDVTYSEIHVNPLYAEEISEEDLLKGGVIGSSPNSGIVDDESEQAGAAGEDAASVESQSSRDMLAAAADAEGDYYTTVDEAAAALREGMKNRELTITVPYATTDSDYSGLLDTIADMALEHTGNPKEGDYLRWQYAGWAGSMNTSVTGQTYYHTLTYTMTYYTNAAQEAAVDQKVADFLKEAPVSASNEYKTIKTIYDFVTQNVSYDYDNLSNQNYKLKYTAYAALVDHKAVCQGYSVLMYRLLLECGIDCRLITGNGINNAGDAEAHGWNIVKIGDHYYNLDATWDSSYYNAYNSYFWFLRNPDSFERHTRDAEYDTEAFHIAYPMSAEDYSGHSLTRVAGKEPTYDNPGYSLYYICDDCRILYSDGEALNTTTKEAVNLPALVKLKTMEFYQNGDMGVNFYYQLADAVVNDPTARVIAAIGTGDPITFSVSDAELDTQTLPGTTLYKFTVPVTSKQLSETVYIHVESDTQSSRTEQFACSDAPSFRTHALLLSGEIGVNFYMYLPGDAREYEDSYVDFTVNGVTKRAEFDPSYTNASGSYYCFTCYVNSVSMAEEIKAEFHEDKDGAVLASDSYSVEQYVEAFESAKASFAGQPKTIALIESLADYGHYVQPFLADSRGWTIGEDYAAMNTFFTEQYDLDAIREEAAQYEIIRDSGSSDIAGITYALMLDAETTIYVYLAKGDNTENLSAAVDGNSVTPILQSDGRYRVEIANISAHKLGDMHTVLASDNAGTATVKVSAMSYVQGLLNAPSYANNSEALNAVASLYKYYEAAAAYKND